jgi:hypothetical protein
VGVRSYPLIFIDEMTTAITRQGEIYVWGWNGARHFFGLPEFKDKLCIPTKVSLAKALNTDQMVRVK